MHPTATSEYSGTIRQKRGEAKLGHSPLVITQPTWQIKLFEAPQNHHGKAG